MAQDRPNLHDSSILGMSIDHPDTSQKVLAVETCKRPGQPGPDGQPLKYMLCQYFDTNIPVGGAGNIGFNVFRADGVHNWNIAVEKEFPFQEANASSPSLLFRSEFINAFNQPQFAEPNLRMSSDTFGEITNTANRGRVVQLSLRLRF
jgi:hypothetical protein